MSKVVGLVLVAAAAAQLNPQTNPRPEPKPYEVSEAYEVYAALLPEEWIWRYAHARYLVIQEETDSEPFFQPVRECLPSTPEFLKTYRSVVGDFEKVNRDSKRLVRKLQIDKPYQLVPRATILGLFKYDAFEGWQSFGDKFPESEGYIDISAVGFNAEKTQALVYTGHSCGALCGGGTYHLLEKKGGKWQEVRGLGCSWAS